MVWSRLSETWQVPEDERHTLRVTGLRMNRLAGYAFRCPTPAFPKLTSSHIGSLSDWILITLPTACVAWKVILAFAVAADDHPKPINFTVDHTTDIQDDSNALTER